MDDMNAARWRYTRDYLAEVFGVEDEAAAVVRARSQQEGLAPIAITRDVGHVLTLLARLTGTCLAIECGRSVATRRCTS